MADKRISQLVERTDIANNDVVPIVASGATTTNKATISSIQEFMQENLDLGVTSVGITLGSSGTDVSVTGSPITTSGNITINIPTASATNRGLLSAADWTTFNDKQPAGNYTTTDTTQTITGVKTFSQDIFVNSRRIGRGSGDITSNTVVGNSALRDNTTGSENSAFGGNSLRQITTGSANTAIGFGSMINSETGSGNTAIGNSTLSGNNGSNNIAVGNSAGRYIAGGTVVNETCLNSVYLGANTRPSLDGNTNEIVIGQNAIGQGSNTVTIGNSSTTLNKLFGRLIHADAVNADESATLGQVNTSLAGYVTLDTAQNITAPKGFINSGGGTCVTLNHTSGSGVALDIIKNGNNEAIRVTKTSGSGNAVTISGGNFEAPTIVRTGGTSSEFLKADGSVDSSTYLTTSSADSTYVPYTGATADVNLGIYNITPSMVYISGAGTGGGGVLNLKKDTSRTVGGTDAANTISVWADGATLGFNDWVAGNVRSAKFSVASITNNATRVYTLPDADGTIALTSNLSAYLPLTGGTLTGALNGTSASFTGNVGIGTASPTAKLEVKQTASEVPFIIDSSAVLNAAYTQYQVNNSAGWEVGMAGGGESYSYLFSYGAFGTANSKVAITNAGNVGIGTDSPATNLHISGTTEMRFGTTSSGSLIQFWKDSSASFASSIGNAIPGDSVQNDLLFATYNGSSWSERMRINEGGILLIGKTGNNTDDAGLLLYQSGVINYVQDYSSGTINYNEFFTTGSGTVRGSITYNGTITSYNSTSDYRLKEDLQDYNGLEIVSKLKTYDFNWKEANVRDYGMIAHELQEVLPSYVNGEKDAVDEDGNIKAQGVDYSKIVPILIKAIQELKTEIDSLKNQIK
jgi:hypothetical protein